MVDHLSLNFSVDFDILFPTDYPQSAPSIGFTQHFPYSMGASYTKQDGPLKGKMVVCLDILGNFDKIHTEWKDNVGSGWTPAYRALGSFGFIPRKMGLKN